MCRLKYADEIGISGIGDRNEDLEYDKATKGVSMIKKD